LQKQYYITDVYLKGISINDLRVALKNIAGENCKVFRFSDLTTVNDELSASGDFITLCNKRCELAFPNSSWEERFLIFKRVFVTIKNYIYHAFGVTFISRCTCNRVIILRCDY